MSKKVIILNAPPSSGKDDGAAFVVKALEGKHCEFKKKLFSLTQVIWDISPEVWDTLYTRELKETPTDLLGGMSPRQALIHTSETVIKPNYGKQYFGKSAARNLGETVSIFSDGGFTEELRPIIEAIGEDNLLVIRVHRPGFTFEGDSRTYLPDGTVKNMIDVYNDGTLEEYLNKLLTEVNEWLSKTKK